MNARTIITIGGVVPPIGYIDADGEIFVNAARPYSVYAMGKGGAARLIDSGQGPVRDKPLAATLEPGEVFYVYIHSQP